MYYTINKGIRKIGSFYLNDLGYKNIHILDSTEKERELQIKDKFNMICRVLPNRIFSIRKNSWSLYHSKKQATDRIKNAIKDIKKDDRYNNYIKNQLINYTKSFKIVELSN